MELDQLRLFADLVREQSFTRVAELNGVTQPAVSLSIARLEDELGTRLLERTTRRVFVTEEGHIFHEYVKEILQKAQEAKQVLRERREGMKGSIRLATVHSIGLYELPGTLKEFIRRYPEVRFHIEYLLADQVYRTVMEGASDLGLVAYPEQRPGLVVEPFFEDELVLICPPEHALAARGSISAQELRGQGFVAFDAEIPTGRAVDAILAEQGISVEIRMQCDNIEILKKMVEVGLGVSMVPLLAVQEEVRSGVLSVLRLEGHTFRRPLGVLHRKAKELSGPQRAFREVLTQETPRLLARDLSRLQLASRSK